MFALLALRDVEGVSIQLEGDEVREGQGLFQIDARPYASALAQAEAVLGRDLVQLANAERDRAMGFCFFNNVAPGAVYALEHFGLERVAIIDWDVHHGNGTQNTFYDDADRQLRRLEFRVSSIPKNDRTVKLVGDIRAAFNRAYVSKDGRIKGDTQTTYLMALGFDLLPAESELGMSLTAAFQLVPEQSTAAIIVHHPAARRRLWSSGDPWVGLKSFENLI